MSSVSRLKRHAAADLAAHEGGRQEVHFQFESPGAFALRATPLGAVEGKPARAVTAQARFGNLGEQPADLVEESDIGGGDGSRRAADGRLIDFVNRVNGTHDRQSAAAAEDGSLSSS